METLRQSPPSRLELNGKVATHPMHSVPRASIELIRYWRVIRPRIKLIGVVVFTVMLAVILFDLFVATPMYRAQTTITPEPPGAEMESAASSALSSMTGGLAGLGMSLMGGDQNELAAQQDIAIVNSYDFTAKLVKQLHLDDRILKRNGVDPSTLSSWKIYELINRQFDTDYDYKNAGLTLYFIDSDPALARQVLTMYLNDLRQKLRSQTARRSEAAVKGLEEEASRTSDPLLRQQIFTVLAFELQRQHTAEMDADYAFKEIEPPVVPSKKYSPHAAQNGLLAGLLAVFAMCAFYLTREWLSHAQAHFESMETTLNPTNGLRPPREPMAEDEPQVANGRTNGEF